jgi:streptogrisin C
MKFRSVVVAGALASLCAAFVPGSSFAAAGTELAWTSEVGLAVERDKPQVFAALQRDLHLSRDEVLRHLGQQRTAFQVETRVKERLGSRYAGSWFSDGRLVVGIVDPNLELVVRNAGGQPKVVKHTRAELDAVSERLLKRPDAPNVLGWNADPMTNLVVVTAKTGTVGEARAWVAAAGVDSTMVRFEEREAKFRPRAPVVAGQPYINVDAGGQCTAGFGVVERPFAIGAGFVTAGHCGSVKSFASTISETLIGQVARSTRGQDNVGDQAYVRLFNDRDATFFARNGGGPLIVVGGSDEAPLGTAVCLEGGTTGQSCGFVTRENRVETLPFVEGFLVVNRRIVGMREATLCSRGGDSGGPVLQLDQAQGTLVAGLGDCGDPGSTPSLYQPIKPVLLQYGLALIGTPESVTPAEPFVITGFGCNQLGGGRVRCNVSWAGDVAPSRVDWTGYDTRQEAPFPSIATDPVARTSILRYICRPHSDTELVVRATVTDAAQRSVFEQLYVPCLRA